MTVWSRISSYLKHRLACNDLLSSYYSALSLAFISWGWQCDITHMLDLSNLIYSVAWSDKISTGLWLSQSHRPEPSHSRSLLQSSLVVTLGAADSLCCFSHNVYTLQYNILITYAYPLTLLISWYPNRLLFFISQVILAIFVAYVVSIILTYTNVFPNDKNHIYYKARTDSRISVLTNAEWFRFPYPGECN